MKSFKEFNRLVSKVEVGKYLIDIRCYDPVTDELIGTITLSYMKQTPEHLFVRAVNLKNKARDKGKGYGEQMYNRALTYAKAHGYKGLSSDPEQRTPDADPFWINASTTSCGFQTVSEFVK